LGILRSMEGSGLAAPGTALASSLANRLMGGGGQQQRSQLPTPQARPTQAASAPPPPLPGPLVTNVPARASFTGGQPPMMTMPYGSDMAARLQALRLLQGQG
jgi:hypothetical protein